MHISILIFFYSFLFIGVGVYNLRRGFKLWSEFVMAPLLSGLMMLLVALITLAIS